jgi:hypothetical protein
MALNLDTLIAAKALNWMHVNGSPTRPTGPLKLRLMTVNGDNDSNGTEVAGGSYASQTITLTTATSTATTNSGAVSFTGMPACTVVGAEIWDSAGSPVRIWVGAFASPQVVNAGGTVTIADGELDQLLA